MLASAFRSLEQVDVRRARVKSKRRHGIVRRMMQPQRCRSYSMFLTPLACIHTYKHTYFLPWWLDSVALRASSVHWPSAALFDGSTCKTYTNILARSQGQRGGARGAPERWPCGCERHVIAEESPGARPKRERLLAHVAQEGLLGSSWCCRASDGA